ncbi:MAG: sigma-70 family RNA polymerase sigma factor [Puniceicoccales bacterium]|jgi:RNA polymerase sigma-70 factor (ECF subfamily)|nr:sigma-70 family RNA polymerase sigma factor [Puniceicoccales bacterium]
MDTVGLLTDASTVLSDGENSSTENRCIDHEVIQKVLQGEVDAFKVLLYRYRKRIYGVIYHITNNHCDAADLTQDTFLRAFQSLHTFRGKSEFYTWLYRIAINLVRKQMRRNKVRKFFRFNPISGDALDKCDQQLIQQTMALNLETDREVILEELQRDINIALGKLSLNHRTAIVLAETEGLTAEAIGKIMGCSAGTVRSRIHYAKEALKRSLARYMKEL